jgi:hypothetical protein
MSSRVKVLFVVMWINLIRQFVLSFLGMHYIYIYIYIYIIRLWYIFLRACRGGRLYTR